MLDIDITVLWQIIAFIVLLPILNKLLYKPFQKVLKERETRTAGALKQAADAEKEIADGIAAYEKRLKEAAVKGHEERNKLRGEAAAQEKDILAAAHVKASAELASMKTELEKSKTFALAKLKEETKAISTVIAEKILDRRITAALLFFILPLIPAVALASSAASGGQEGGDSGMLWKLVNFAILAAGIVIVWFKFIRKLLDNRSQDIKKALDAAKEAKDTADRKAAEYRDKLALLEKSVADVQRELALEGAAEKKRMIAEAQKAAEKLIAQARLTAEQEVKKAKAEIKKEVAELASRMAEEILKKELTGADQERLVKTYIEKMRLHGQTGQTGQN